MSSTYAGFMGNSGMSYGLSGAGEANLDSDYRSLHMRAVVGQLLGRITGRQTALRSLSKDLEGYRICGQRHVGIKSVSLDRIIGSEGRSEDFDSQFRPLKTHTRDRWTSVARARAKDIPLPAIDLIQVGDDYYVRDGNHRVSVAKARGQVSIDASITELMLAPRPAQELPTQTIGWAMGRMAAAAA
jgi:hypothetical protein